MKIEVYTANLIDAGTGAQDFSNWLEGAESPPDFLALHLSVATLEAQLRKVVPDTVALHGATSCLGVMGNEGPKIENGIGAFAIWDEDGDYGSSLSEVNGKPRQAAERAVSEALMAANRPGEAPDLIWLSASPGCEEEILAGLESVVGGNVPILGGSAADNSVSGEWRVFDKHLEVADGIMVTVLFPSKPISFAYHNGYAPTDHVGVVTKSDGRLLQEIDGQPAAKVYRDWIGNDTLPEKVERTTAILSESTLTPLGRYLDSVGSVPYYLLAHPAGLTSADELELFADIDVGDRITLMNGSIDQLTQRAGKVASLAAQSRNMSPQSIAGALMVYCGGCMLAVQDHLDDVTAGINQALPNVPYLGIFTFGEQGVVLDGRNRHGNLMISAVTFGA